jgi:hypothetical protein
VFDFFKRAALLIAISLHICGMDNESKENLSQSDSNITANSKRKISRLSNPGQKIKETAAQKRLCAAAKGTKSILGFLQPRSNTANSQSELSLSSNSLAGSRSLSSSAAIQPLSETPAACSPSVINSKTEKEDTSEPVVFSVVSSAFFTEKVVRVPFFPEAQNAIAQIIWIEDSHYWGNFLINSKLKHDVIHCFDDLESAEKWVFDIAKKLKITLNKIVIEN